VKVDWTDLALDRVDEIGRYIAEDNLEVKVLSVRHGSQPIRDEDVSGG